MGLSTLQPDGSTFQVVTFLGIYLIDINQESDNIHEFSLTHPSHMWKTWIFELEA